MAEEESAVLVYGMRLLGIIKQYAKLISIAGACLTIIGFILLLVYRNPTVLKTEKELDYTNCKKFDIENSNSMTCKEYMEEAPDIKRPCDCYVSFDINEPLEGQVIIYYELASYDQNLQDYINSRDDDQLKGVVSLTPSENCEPFRYVTTSEGKKPIVPCGKIADSMFTDSMGRLVLKSSNSTGQPENVNFSQFGILSAADKSGFKNPENLDLAYLGFSKPKSWDMNIWELDKTNADNNGFENEVFIGWMRTDWKRKPLYRIDNQNGLQIGTYEVLIRYNYPITKYAGQRKLIFVTTRTESHDGLYTLGAVFFSIGLILLVAVAAVYIRQYLLDKKMANKSPEAREGANPSEPDVRQTPLLTNQQPGVNTNGETNTRAAIHTTERE